MSIGPDVAQYDWNLNRTIAYLAGEGITASDELRAQIAQYLTNLYLANETSNLTRVPPEQAEERHVLDSLLILQLVPQGESVVDIGSGPGLPGWLLAVCRPDLTVTCVESSGKFARFIQSMPLPNLSVLEQRAEENPKAEKYGVATGRAVARFGIQAELSAAWLKIGGRFIPYRTPADRPEIIAANIGTLGLKLQELHEIPLPGTDMIRLFPEYAKVRSTDPQYPRTWAKIKARPLGI